MFFWQVIRIFDFLSLSADSRYLQSEPLNASSCILRWPIYAMHKYFLQFTNTFFSAQIDHFSAQMYLSVHNIFSLCTNVFLSAQIHIFIFWSTNVFLSAQIFFRGTNVFLSAQIFSQCTNVFLSAQIFSRCTNSNSILEVSPIGLLCAKYL